jgi:carbon monoxide dehydrogenase subunit G
MADLQVTTASRFPRSRILTATDASEVSEDPRSLLVKADGPKISSVMDGEIDAEVPELKPEENKEEQSVAVQQDEEEEFP